MNHILTGWVLANANKGFTTRERMAITLACIVPDLDGLGIIAEYLTHGSDTPFTWWGDFHHVLAHNLLFGFILTLAVYLLFQRNWIVAALVFISFHLHLLQDLLSGRHADGHIWSIQYLYPFSNTESDWSGQWELNAWPNFAVAVFLLLLTFYLAWKRGYSPLEMISRHADRLFVSSLRERFGHRQDG